MAGQDQGSGSLSGEGGLLRQLSEGLAAAVARASASTVRVEARRRLGATGIIWTADGLIVTADHVVERDEDIVVGLADGRELPATVAGRDPGSDLALLTVAEQGLAAADRAKSGELRVGHLVLALGRPGEGAVAASMGIVSAIGGPWRARRGAVVEGYVKPDLTMYPGFSGGPLVDTSGRLVGLNSSHLAHGMSMALSIATLERVVAVLREHGRVRQGYLGLRTQQVTLPQNIAVKLGQEIGLLVVGFEPGGPADQGGVMLGDVLVALGGQPLRGGDDLQTMLGGERIGQPVSLAVLRASERRELAVVVGERS